MKNRGFTLIELLGVMIILCVILFLVLPSVTNIIDLGKENIYDIQIKKILDSTYDYTISNTNLLPESGEKKYITLNLLKKEGFVETVILDTITGEEIPNDLVISIEKIGKGNEILYTNNYYIKGDYLYYVGIDNLNNHEYIIKKPTIKVTGYSSSLFASINLNSEFNIPSVTAISSDEVDITDDVVINIVHNSANVSYIDTSNAGIYYINYCVVDSYGYSNCAVLNVVVVDNELPTLIGLDSVNLDINTTSFDLMYGVSCKDNSGKCDIDINGNIKYGISGTYTIEYIATDPSGNTFSQKRVIKIS